MSTYFETASGSHKDYKHWNGSKACRGYFEKGRRSRDNKKYRNVSRMCKGRMLCDVERTGGQKNNSIFVAI